MKSIVDEARDAFEMYNLEQGGVLWVGSECGKYSLSWEDFVEAYGDLVCLPQEEVSLSAAYDLVKVFENCWLCRFNECGQSGWEYFSQPKLQEETFKPIRTKHHTHKILIAVHNAMSNFEDFKHSGPERTGICDRISDIVAGITNQHMTYDQLEGCFLTWEGFSGDLSYPLPLTTDFLQQWRDCPDKRTPEEWVYYNCLLWEGEQERMRRSLCKHIQKCIREHLKSRNCKFEEVVC